MKLRTTTAAAITTVFACLSQGAIAGSYTGSNVNVGSMSASGSIMAARFSGDSKQQIGCSLGTYVTNVTDTTAHLYLSCTGTDASGNTYYCYDSTPPDSWVKIVVALNTTSWIYFYGDSQHHCQGLSSSQLSSNYY